MAKNKNNQKPEFNVDNEEMHSDSSIIQSSDQPFASPSVSEGFDSNIEEIAFEPEFDGQYLIPTKITQKREETRGTLALVFILGFFIMLTLGGLLVAFNREPLEFKVKYLQDVFLVISGVLSGPLGFVVGYYFRKQEQSEN